MAADNTAARGHQAAFAQAAARQLRNSRKQQRITQTEVSRRTGGAISKAALANYETGHRSMRIEVFWAIAKALDVDAGVLIRAAERESGNAVVGATDPVTVEVAAIEASTDPLLAPVRRWFALRGRNGGRGSLSTITLDEGALVALAELMGLGVVECRRLLAAIGQADTGDATGVADRAAS